MIYLQKDNLEFVRRNFNIKMVHVTIYTGCLEESIKFYEDIVGLKIQNDLRQFGEKIVFLAKGLNPTPMIAPDPHVKFFFVEDPNGVTVQFI